MRFLPLPRGTGVFVIAAVAVLLAFVGWGTIRYPETFWAPGDLSRFHADIPACADCHQPFQGASASKCVSCHDEKHFVSRSKPAVSEFHQKVTLEGKSCSGCHTEHRGALAQITVGAMINPHGEFVFRATGTFTCTACHDFGDGLKSRSFLLDNAVVRHLMEAGKGGHQRGQMAQCLACHTDGRVEIDGERNETD